MTLADIDEAADGVRQARQLIDDALEGPRRLLHHPQRRRHRKDHCRAPF